jgi:hypothetical protein
MDLRKTILGCNVHRVRKPLSNPANNPIKKRQTDTRQIHLGAHTGKQERIFDVVDFELPGGMTVYAASLLASHQRKGEQTTNQEG